MASASSASFPSACIVGHTWCVKPAPCINVWSQGQAFGGAPLLAMILLMRNIHQLRESPEDADALRAQNQTLLAWLRTLCETHQTVAHEDSRKLAGEFLNDWDAIVRVVETPSHPLTNNVAERSLR